MKIGVVLVLGVSAVNASVLGQPNVLYPNDDCQFATPISGDGIYQFDLTYGTTSGPPLPQGCTNGPAPAQPANDLWYCYTATVTGTVRVSTFMDPNYTIVGTNILTAVDTILAIYEGCGCPTQPPRCCNDDVDPVDVHQSTVVCDVVCGQRYLIRIGSKLGTPPGPGAFSVRTQGQPCLPAPGICSDCCGGVPKFSDPLYANFQNGRVAIETSADYQEADAARDVVVRVFDLDAQPCPTPGSNWSPEGTTPPFRYPPPPTAGNLPVNDWTRRRLGTVFGLTLDNSGNIYVAHHSGYLAGSTIGSLGGDTSTSVYKLSSGTFNGTPSLFVNLPGGTSNTFEPGLGNIHHDCATRNFYVSHFADGRIYRVDTSGVVQSAWDFATDTLSPGAATEPGTDYRAFAPHGERVWAVHTREGRLYFSQWGQNQDQSSFFNTFPVDQNSTIPNRIWSVGLTGSGEFIVGTRRQEIQPPYNSHNRSDAAGTVRPKFSNPVSDIAFSERCWMLLAERSVFFTTDSMGQLMLQTSAHRSRLLEYGVAANGAWTTTGNYNTARGFPVSIGAGPEDCAGGVDVDFKGPPPQNSCPPEGRYWASGDFLVGAAGGFVYGMSGLLPTGATFGNNVYIDYNGVYVGTQDKTKLGDVEIPCPPACVEIIDKRILCEVVEDPTGQGGTVTGKYVYTFCFVNNTNPPVPIQYIGFTTPGVSPQTIAFPTPILPGQTSPPITLTLMPPAGATQFCWSAIFMNPQIEVCCQVEHCIDLPPCDCVQWPVCEVEATPVPNSWNLTFTAQNLSMGPINQLFLFPEPPGTAGFTVAPSFFSFPSVPVGGTAGPFTVKVDGVSPGQTVCIRVSIHDNGMECCSEVKCFDIPGTTLCREPVVLEDPAPTEVCVNQTATFSAMAFEDPVGGPMVCQWRRNGSGLTDGPTPHGSIISGATAASLTITNARPADSGDYDVVLGNDCGFVATNEANLNVIVILGDANLDNVINFADITEVLVHFGMSAPPPLDADVNGDGVVDFMDLTIVLVNFGQTCP